jgi:hypothetical protein
MALTETISYTKTALIPKQQDVFQELLERGRRVSVSAQGTTPGAAGTRHITAIA